MQLRLGLYSLTRFRCGIALRWTEVPIPCLIEDAYIPSAPVLSCTDLCESGSIILQEDLRCSPDRLYVIELRLSTLSGRRPRLRLGVFVLVCVFPFPLTLHADNQPARPCFAARRRLEVMDGVTHLKSDLMYRRSGLFCFPRLGQGSRGSTSRPWVEQLALHRPLFPPFSNFFIPLRCPPATRG